LRLPFSLGLNSGCLTYLQLKNGKIGLSNLKIFLNSLLSQGALMQSTADIGLIGLAVMGQNLVLNMDDHGYTVVVYNRTVAKVDEFLANGARGTSVIGAHSLEELVSHLKRPRRVMLMIKAGKPVDDFIELLLPLLEPGDILIDGGNSNFEDTIRRTHYVESKGLLFIGTGVSGGEEGARHGPSIMPGGSPQAWPHVKPIFQAIAAKVNEGEVSVPCCDWVGANGAGHFVKMVHNGIEYGDMQLISESYDLLRSLLNMDAESMQVVFSQWNRGKLDSYLIEITSHILAYKDDDGLPLLDKILDAAGQKGTGRWTVMNALELGIPLTLIAEAVLARSLSDLKDERMLASKSLKGPQPVFTGDKGAFVDDIRQALYAAKIISYTQGYMLMSAAAKEYGWDLNYGSIALMWRGGCIIRSAFLGEIKRAYERDLQLPNLLLDPYFNAEVDGAQAAWRRVIAKAVENGIPVPAMSSALAFFDGYRHDRLPANLLQAQRDYFGAHTYERVDRPRGEFFHTNWTGSGGQVTSSTYDA
jgi:6-phosphogluconate dehydrogenase